MITGRATGVAGRRGSGYRVSGCHVVTAAHVVQTPAVALRVRFEADRPAEWAAGARVVFSSAGADLALLELTDLPAGLPSALAPPRFGGVPDADVTVQVSAVGFPLFKMRQPAVRADRAAPERPTRYRDSCHVDGRVSVLSNRREGTLEVAVAPPADEVGPDRSPWEGMSGAAVWFGDAIIGVIAAHHRADGLNRLAAVRVARWYEVLAEDELAMMHRHAGLPPQLPIAGEPSFPAVPSRLLSLLNPAELWQVTDAMAALPSLRRPGGLDTVLEEADPRLAAQRPRDGSLRFEVHGLLRTCRRYPGTFSAVTDALRHWEQDSAEVSHLERILRRLALKYG
ncbi:effector-associated domain 2-containing protein [Streptomyces blattellae]|uniref:effector-associated domain 2-containing protein n=1 Tax=Streptomyces blattellae TaxID=2569855 RepID=UPI00228769CF|nr:trypsin-like peptidase domain-containing protein [Streptomyces blattellae]